MQGWYTPSLTCCPLRNDAAGYAAFAATILGLIGIIVATLVDYQRSARDVGQFQTGRLHRLIDALARGVQCWKVCS